MGANCRGIVTTDVLEQGLSCRAIALGSLRGLIGTKDTREFYTSSAPYGVGKATSSWVGIDVSMTREQDTLCLALDGLFLALSRQRVILLYTQVDALRLTESWPAHKQCPAR